MTPTETDSPPTHAPLHAIAETARMICLAYSDKHNGKCIAGVRIDDKQGQWLRPVGMTATGELYPTQFRLPDGTDPRPGDIVDVPLYETASRKQHHPEDRHVAGAPWVLITRPAPPEVLAGVLRRARVSGPDLFGCRAPKTTPAKGAAASLALVLPQSVRFQVEPDVRNARVGELPRFRFRVWFFLDGAIHDLPLTDTAWRRRLGHLSIGSYDTVAVGLSRGEMPFLVCSLGEPFARDGFCYKLVASVIAAPVAGSRGV